MPKSKRKPPSKASVNPAADMPPVPPVLPAPEVAQVARAAEVAEASHAALDKDCPACHAKLPVRARYCSRCGEPQLPGVQRPVQLFIPAPPTAVPQATASPPPAVPSQVTVPSAPRIGAVRTGGPTVVPVLSAERPIPVSLLNPEAQAPEPVAPTQGPEPAPVPQPAPVQHVAPPPAPTPAPAPQPLWDLQTETRILALHTGREMTSDRFERVMAGFKLKPKPRAPAAKPKAAPKDAPKDAGKDKGKAPEKAAAKPAAKPAKGH